MNHTLKAQTLVHSLPNHCLWLVLFYRTSFRPQYLTLRTCIQVLFFTHTGKEMIWFIFGEKRVKRLKLFSFVLSGGDKTALTLCLNGVFILIRRRQRDLHWAWNREENGWRLLVRKCPAAQDLWEITYSVTFTYWIPISSLCAKTGEGAGMQLPL